MSDTPQPRWTVDGTGSYQELAREMRRREEMLARALKGVNQR